MKGSSSRAVVVDALTYAGHRESLEGVSWGVVTGRRHAQCYDNSQTTYATAVSGAIMVVDCGYEQRAMCSRSRGN
jgi:hypothetical protein